MKFIKGINDGTCQSFIGQQISPAVCEILNAKLQQNLPILSEKEITVAQDHLLAKINDLSAIYLKPQVKMAKLAEVELPLSSRLVQLNSKIVKDLSQIDQLFDEKI